MYRLAAATVLASLVLTGCGSGGSPAGGASTQPSSTPGTGTTATTRYFVTADTNAINRAAAAAQQAGARAQATAATSRCNRATKQGYDAWRGCWHRLLDPFRRSLTGLAAELRTLAGHDLPGGCVTGLGRAARTFRGRS